MHPICLPTLEGGLEGGLLATEAVTPMVYSRRLTNKLGGCLVTLCSWGAHRSSAHTPVSLSSSRPILQSDGFAPLHNGSVGEQAYSDHFGGHRATGQSNGRNGTQHTLRRLESSTDFACHH